MRVHVRIGGRWLVGRVGAVAIIWSVGADVSVGVRRLRVCVMLLVCVVVPKRVPLPRGVHRV